MYQFNNKINALLLFLPILSFIGGLWHGQYVNDGYHWGFIFANALDFLDGKKPYEEIFIQYGFISTLIHSFVLFLFNKNIFSLVVLTSFFYSASLYLIGVLTYRFTLNKTYSLFSIVVLFFVNPWPTSPWPNFIAFFFVILFSLLYLSKDRSKIILSGVSLSIAYLSLTIVYNFIILSFIICLLLLIFYLKKKYDFFFIKKNIYFLTSFFLSTLIFFIYLYTSELIDIWLIYQKLPFIFANVYDISLFDRISNYFNFYLFYSFANFIYEPQFLIFSIIFFTNLYFLFNSLLHIYKKKFNKFNMDLFVINLLIFSLNFKAQLFGIEKLSTSIALGVITLMVIIHSIKNLENRIIINFIILFVSFYSLIFAYEMNNSDYSGARNIHFRDLKNISKKKTNDKIEYFSFQKWSDNTWHPLNSFVEIQKKIKNNCDIKYGANLTSNTYFYVLMNYEKIQVVPFLIKTHSHILRNIFEPNLIKDIQKQINNDNIVIISFENNNKLLNLENYQKPKKINLNEHTDKIKKNLYIYIPNSCQI